MNKVQWWEISFYEINLNVRVTCEIKAASFDEALAVARKIDPRFDTGCVMGWREE